MKGGQLEGRGVVSLIWTDGSFGGVGFTIHFFKLCCHLVRVKIYKKTTGMFFGGQTPKISIYFET